MAIQSTQVAVSTTAVLLGSGGSNGIRLSLYNPSGPTVYLGPGTAISGTANYGMPGTATMSMYLEQSETLYGLTSAGTATVHVLSGGV
jgi:hypothetical protein